MKKQKTIAQAVTFQGIGVHSGKPSQVTLQPGQADMGIRLHNGQIHEQAMIIGTVIPENAMHATVLKAGSWWVSTVEHLLAALRALEVGNVDVIVSGCEVPIIDGSALPFVQGIMRAGIVELDAPQKFLTPKEVIRFADDQGRWLEIEPASVGADGNRDIRMHIDYRAEFTRGLEGADMLNCTVSPEFFTSDIAPARTFGFVEQLPFLRQHGLALGTSLGNTVVMGPDGLFNDMRCADECVRHKVLDLIGDLALLGKPLAGSVRAYKTGHNFNRKVIEHYVGQPQVWEEIY
jgi:UDP-3-O-[3-hydroxymyristoyl] N-acetylglucosamine deacetylase